MDNSNEQIKLMGSAIEGYSKLLEKGISDEGLSESIRMLAELQKTNGSVQEKYLDQQSMLAGLFDSSMLH